MLIAKIQTDFKHTQYTPYPFDCSGIDTEQDTAQYRSNTSKGKTVHYICTTCIYMPDTPVLPLY